MFIPMNENPFPKPPPAAPLPLEDWLELTDRAEVGRELFFGAVMPSTRCFEEPSKALAGVILAAAP